MNSLREQLERIGLSQYYNILVDEGFDTWETVLDVTESDLTTLGVKLGHRRKLQRAIAEARGQSSERALSIEVNKLSTDGAYRSDDSGNEAKESSGGRATPATPLGASATGTKRKYRRHPKPDESAPERPPSAYVIFSNQVREELRGQDLSFTEIAKLVGERWQVLSPDIRDACERQAATAKEKYYNELSEYKKTPQYSQYQQYLADFKLKHAAPRTGRRRELSDLPLSPVVDLEPDRKRSRIETETYIEAAPSTLSSGYDKLGEKRSVTETSTAGHLRSLSNPLTRQTPFSIGNYRPPSASTSPATYSVGTQSPITAHAHSPHSSPPAAAGFYGSYDLPHHARSGQSSAEARTRESTVAGYFPSSSYTRWQNQSEEHSSHTAERAHFVSRRPLRSGSSIPSLVHTDTTHSSHSEVLPPTPHQGTLLPPLDPPKGDRTLPSPIPTSSVGLVLPPPTHLSQSASQDFDDGPQWPALLRASQLARDADLNNEELKRQSPP